MKTRIKYQFPRTDPSTSTSTSILTLSVLICSVFGCLGQVTDYHHSGDFSTHVIYFGTNFAVVKATNKGGETSFGFGKAHWAGDPELASQTGDSFKDGLDIGFEPDEVGISDNNAWILLKGRKLDEKEFEKNRIVRVKIVCAIAIASGMDVEASDEDALHRKLDGIINVKAIRLEAPAIFFDRMLVTYLTRKGRVKLDGE